MKFKGKKIEGVPTEYIPIIRPEGNIVFTVKGIQSLGDFKLVCPIPDAPRVKLPGGKYRYDFEDKAYKLAIDKWFLKRAAWVFIKSIEETKDFEWDAVNPSDPETFLNCWVELKAGFIEEEVESLVSAVLKVNAMNQGLLDMARESFLKGEAEPEEQPSSPMVEAPSTSSGEHAEALVSVHQGTKT